jgi:aminoglycoside phosphotransferase (APT) family kinase protein
MLLRPRNLSKDQDLSGSNPELLSPVETVPVDWDRLARYLETQGLTFDPAQSIRQFAGGFANRNYLIVVDGRQTVLRRPPDGDLPPGAHDMSREHRILLRLADALSFIPKSLHLCESRDIIGVPFQLIEYYAGVVVRGTDMSPVASHPDAPDLLCNMMVTTLATLHQVDARSVGLESLGKPQGFLARAIAGWSKRGVLVSEAPRTQALIHELSDWLGRQRFGVRDATILHCDFKLDNLILNPANLSPVALIDWDMGTRGDPLFDLATLLSYWVEPGDPAALDQLQQMPTAQPGFWLRAQVAKRYAELTGCDLADLPAMRVLALLKLGVVFLQLHRQWVNGAVRNQRHAEFGKLGEALLMIAHDLTTGKSNG